MTLTKVSGMSCAFFSRSAPTFLFELLVVEPPDEPEEVLFDPFSALAVLEMRRLAHRQNTSIREANIRGACEYLIGCIYLLLSRSFIITDSHSKHPAAHKAARQAYGNPRSIHV